MLRRGLLLASLAAGCIVATPVAARDLVDVLRRPDLTRLGLAPLGPLLAGSVASTYPVASASASVVYTYDPALETLRRAPGIAGPLFGERSETIGRGQLNVGLSWSHVRLTDLDGESLDELVNRPTVGGRFIIFPQPGGVFLADGRFTNYLPVRVRVDLDVEADLVTPAATYGITPDLDVNVSLPLVRTSLDVSALTLAPDPRRPAFSLASGAHLRGVRSGEDEAFGIGDLLLRTKYVLRRGAPFDLAAGLGLSLPTGDSGDLHGRGTILLQPVLIASRAWAGRVETLLNLGVDVDGEHHERSAVRWATGVLAQIVDPLALVVGFLGRHELNAQGERLRLPFFFQVRRYDLIDAAAGLRWRFAEDGMVTLDALVPLNDDGLRAEVVPTLQVEYGFPTFR